MDPVILLVAFGGVLLIYQLFFAKDWDALDKRGHPLHRKRR